MSTEPINTPGTTEPEDTTMTENPTPTMQKIGTAIDGGRRRSGSDYGYLARDESGVVHFVVDFTDHELDPLPATPSTPTEV